MNGGVVLLEMDYALGKKHSYRGQHYILQNVLILKAVQVPFYTMEHSSLFMLDQAPREDARPLRVQVNIRVVLRVVTLSPRSVK